MLNIHFYGLPSFQDFKYIITFLQFLICKRSLFQKLYSYSESLHNSHSYGTHRIFLRQFVDKKEWGVFFPWAVQNNTTK